jgi:exopolysaccharide biosynthesis polyprenyl glycosylphosphotransferase
MTRILGHYVPIEMTVLWLTELTLCFGLGYAMLNTGISGTDPAALDIAAVMAVSAGLISFAIGLYRAETFLRLRRLMAKTAIAGLLSFPAIWVAGNLAGVNFGLLQGPGAMLPVKMLASWMALMLLLRLAFSYSLRMQMFTRRIVIVGSGDGAARTAAAIESLRNGLFEISGTVRSFGPSQENAEAMMDQLRRRRVWGVVLAGQGPQIAAVKAALAQAGSKVRIWGERDFWEGQLRRVDIEQLDANSPIVATSGALQAAIRRVSDIVLSLFLLTFTLPLMLITAIIIRFDSPGPIFYRQERSGLNGRPFVLCKFRSMCLDAERSGPIWAAKRDSRVTRVGAFIRNTRIDELPQLMNVLRGEMSFIGPRPERPHFVEQLASLIPPYGLRAQVKPGLTGWAQVNYPYGASVEDARMKLSYDLYYVAHRSLILDILILFATVRVILFQEGAR